MLVLTRKIGESIVIPGCDLTITVSKIKGKQVCLAIAAPQEVDVFRQEVWQRQNAFKAEPVASEATPV
ncbi:MAG: carbon storage regulator [Gemmataceae bacterium]